MPNKRTKPSGRMRGVAPLLEMARQAGQAAAEARSAGGPVRAGGAGGRRAVNSYGAAALQFRQRHPEAFALFVGFALEMRAAGLPYIGVGLLYERVRWELLLRGQVLPLDNNYRAHFARWAVAEYPELRGLIHVRTLRRA